MEKVRLLGRRNNAAIVEWTELDGPHRAIVPSENVISGQCEREVLSLGIQLGEWDAMIDLSGLPERIATELRKRGIWERGDIENVTAVRAAFLSSIEQAIQVFMRQVTARGG